VFLHGFEQELLGFALFGFGVLNVFLFVLCEGRGLLW
jgi:hypothetical protein